MSRFFIGVILSSFLCFAASVPKPAVASDAVIEAALRSKLAKSKIGADQFKFRVQGGSVFWEGITDVVQHKGAATRMAKSAGAKRVVNNIQISAAGRAKARSYLGRDRRHVAVKPGEPRSAPRAEVIRR